MIGLWNSLLCGWLPWHTWSAVERLSAQSERIVCDRCGRQYAINHYVRAVLPWASVEHFYRDRGRMCR